jgi:Protein of unknown function (DUF2939)
MRWVAVFVAVAIALYVASPYFTLWKLEQAIEQKDDFQLERLVDWPRIREQMKAEMTAAFLPSMSNEVSRKVVPSPV